MSDCTTCGDNQEQTTGYGGETIEDPNCYPTGCPPCAEEISFPENPLNGQRQCFFIGKDPNTGEDQFKCWVYDHCIPGWRAEGASVSPINFAGSVDLTKSPADNNVNNPNPGDYFVVSKASESQEFLDTNWPNLQHESAVGTYIMWSGTEWLGIFPPCGTGSGPAPNLPIINLDACGGCSQALEMYWGLQPASINISNAVVTGNSATIALSGTGQDMKVNWSSSTGSRSVVQITIDSNHVGENYKDGDTVMLSDQTTWGFLGYFTDYENLPDAGEMVTNADTTNVVGSSTGLKVDYQIRTVGGDPLNKWIWVIANIEGVGMQRGDTFTIDGLPGVEIRYDAPQFRLRDISDEIFLTQTACDPATIGCDRLPIASDVNRGIVQLATSLDPTTPGYYSDAVTPALLQRILDSFRQDELDIGDTTQVTRHYAESGVWRPLQPSRLVKVVVQLIGAGGGGAANGDIVATDHTGNPVWCSGQSGDGSRWGLSKELTAEEAGTEATITIGTGGTASQLRVADQGGTAPTPGTATIFQTNGTIGQILMPGGAAGGEITACAGGWPNGWYPSYGPRPQPSPAEPVNIETFEVNYEISGKGYGGPGESEYDNSFSPGRPAYDGGPGYLIINEFYPHNGQRIYNNG